jgi:hypothetical protein
MGQFDIAMVTSQAKSPNSNASVGDQGPDGEIMDVTNLSGISPEIVRRLLNYLRYHSDQGLQILLQPFRVSWP